MTAHEFELADFAMGIARKAGKMIMAQLPLGLWRRSPIEHKAGRELVSEVDRAAERMILAAIRQRYPDHGIVAEESGVAAGGHGEAEFRWIVDPLDGTTNYLHGHPLFAVSVAVEQLRRRDHADGRAVGAASTAPSDSEDDPPVRAEAEGAAPDIVAGAVFLPYLGETFLAARGGGAFLNSRSIRLSVSDTDDLADSLVATGFAYDRDRYPNYDNFVRVARRARGIRRCGAASIDLAFVAAGRYEAFWELGLRAHDVAAGALLVREAGGCVEDLSGGPNWLDGGDIIASNGRIHAAMRELLETPALRDSIP